MTEWALAHEWLTFFLLLGAFATVGTVVDSIASIWRKP